MSAAPVDESRRYRLTVAYDGTDYAGWQIQPNGMTVQQKLEEALGQLVSAVVKIHGSGRTDQGVHARGQVAHTDLCTTVTCSGIKRALNAMLPADIRIHDVSPAAADFHARKSAIGKEYRYLIWNGDVVPPWLHAYRTRIRRPLDVVAMREAAGMLVGEHDFAAFTANPNRVVESTVRTITRLDVRKRGRDLAIIAAGNGFLYKMVRSVAGWLIRVGEGDVSATDTTAILDSRERTARVPTAPPEGLFLWHVTY